MRVKNCRPFAVRVGIGGQLAEVGTGEEIEVADEVGEQLVSTGNFKRTDAPVPADPERKKRKKRGE